MYAWDIAAANSQLAQVSSNADIVLQQINKIPYTRTDEIGMLRESVRALMNSTQQLNAVCSALLREVKVTK
jgi:hypothetical protein